MISNVSILGPEGFNHEAVRRNLLKGTVLKIVSGSVNSEVTLELAGGPGGVDDQQGGRGQPWLKEGMPAYAVIKASNVMIAVD